MHRRAFLAAGPAGVGVASVGWWSGCGPGSKGAGELVEESLRAGAVSFVGDGLGLTPQQYAALLASLSTEAEDLYGEGGAVARLEHSFAAALGKERAVFMPTGTLANHVAIRRLTRGKPRVLVPAESHIYNDSGDCAQQVSGVNLVPLGPGRAGFTLDEVTAAIDRAEHGRVPAKVGAIVIESPVRRRRGEVVDWAEAQRIADFARARGIGLHLDGARLFIASAYTGIAPADYAAAFDTVYVSLYKSFNAASGAILAGPAALLEDVHHERRMLGGGLRQAWPFAAVAAAYLEGFTERLRAAVAVSEETLAGLQAIDSLAIERIAGGTNVFELELRAGDAEQLRTRLSAGGIDVPAPEGRRFTLRVNETASRMTAAAQIEAFRAALVG